MADICDITDERIEARTNDAINKAHNYAESIPAGSAGECDQCGEDMPRLVAGVCCRCRDKFAKYKQPLIE